MREMKARHKKKALDRLETDKDYDGGFPPEVVKAFRKRMQFIRSAMDERDFRALRGLRFKRMEGDRRHQYSIRLNDQWRLIIEFEGRGREKTALIINIEDYH